MSSPSVFLLGATGYIGGQVLLSLANDFPEIPIRALARNLSPDKIAALHALHPKIEPIDGSLTDVKIIEEEAKKADIVINVAIAGDLDSINAIIRGQLQRSRSYTPHPTPIYIHMSGAGLLGDSARGELLTPRKIWVDTEFNSSSLKESKVDLLKNACEVIVEAGKTGDIRTMIVMPGLVYGVGPGLQKISLPHRFFLNFTSETGYCGTFGPGRNIGVYVHLRDVANAVSVILKGALDGGKNGSIGEGEEGFYFVGSRYMIALKDFCAIIGDTLFKQGLISKPGSSPYSVSVAEKAGAFGYPIFGSNSIYRSDRLEELGWTAEQTEVESIYESLPQEIELGVKEMALRFKTAES
ncbi:hypothetical protein GYMLUDRAFT_47563 [Collybiopsis luxurians FD-317 M1]|uniref:NAD(P)-binding domain-containing protein n=1 Tax=Collybiopsis luxurians FD-317 M1 TaxID=944289 RepID=A0A0D0CCM0_9AGAR|nr:hypothetical protein GYMLUDRAFT_47563 [Collybiopsis luxurians FD-317 M1]